MLIHQFHCQVWFPRSLGTYLSSYSPSAFNTISSNHSPNPFGLSSFTRPRTLHFQQPPEKRRMWRSNMPAGTDLMVKPLFHRPVIRLWALSSVNESRFCVSKPVPDTDRTASNSVRVSHRLGKRFDDRKTPSASELLKLDSQRLKIGTSVRLSIVLDDGMSLQKPSYELTSGVCEQLAKFMSDGMWQLESPPPAAYIRTC